MIRISICAIFCAQVFVHNPSPMDFFSVKKIVSEINPLKTLEKKVVRFTKQNDHRFKRVWKQQWTRSSEDEGEKFHGSFGGNVHFLEKKPQATNCDNWDDGMFFNVAKQFSRKKHTTVHPQAAILGGFAVFLAWQTASKNSPSVFMKTSGVPTNCTKLPANFMVWGWSIIWILGPMIKRFAQGRRGAPFLICGHF